MDYIYLNLKRFDIPPELNGINKLAPIQDWASNIITKTQEELKAYDPEKTKFVMFFPEAHLLNAVGALSENSPLSIGCQSVYRENTALGKNFGAFTSNRPANAMKALGVHDTIIGHCEERNDKRGILLEAGIEDESAINRVLNKQIKCAVEAGMKVLYCIGETAQQQDRWEETLREQLEIGLRGIDRSMVSIAYEPVWAIGPGKTPPNKEYIQKIARFIIDETDGAPIVYGGGLKADNAKEIASIPEIKGGLIALTRFAGDIGFYPEEYLEIIKTYFSK